MIVTSIPSSSLTSKCIWLEWSSLPCKHFLHLPSLTSSPLAFLLSPHVHLLSLISSSLLFLLLPTCQRWVPQPESPDLFYSYTYSFDERIQSLCSKCLLRANSSLIYIPSSISIPNSRLRYPTTYSISPLRCQRDMLNTTCPRINLGSSAPTLLHPKSPHFSKSILVVQDNAQSVCASSHSLPCASNSAARPIGYIFKTYPEASLYFVQPPSQTPHLSFHRPSPGILCRMSSASSLSPPVISFRCGNQRVVFRKKIRPCLSPAQNFPTTPHAPQK